MKYTLKDLSFFALPKRVAELEREIEAITNDGSLDEFKTQVLADITNIKAQQTFILSELTRIEGLIT